MNMKTKFQKIAEKIVTKTFGDVAQLVTIRRPIYENYDEVTGSLISSHDDYEVKGIVGPWNKDNSPSTTSSGIMNDDLQLIIARITLVDEDGNVIEAEVNRDSVILPDGSEYLIIQSFKDPAEASIVYRLSKDTDGV